MSEAKQRFYSGDVTADDFREVSRLSRGRSRVRKWLRWTAAIFACVPLGAAFVFGSRPALSPQEIVQSDTYQGKQQPRRIFNLNSVRTQTSEQLRPRVTVSENLKEAAPDLPPLNETAAVVSSNTEVPAAAGDGAPVMTGRKIPEDVIVRIASSQKSAVKQPASSSRMLPLYIVIAQNVKIRRQPAQDSPSVKLLEQGAAVTLFSETGDWAQVAANDGSGTTGYVRSTSIRRLE